MTEHSTPPWHGILVATPLPFNDDLSPDYDAFAEHIQFLAANGPHGAVPNGSLGEYQTLTEEERKRVVEVAFEAAPYGFVIAPGVGAYGALESVRFTEHAAELGAKAVMLLPPNTYRATDEAVLDHFRRVAAVGVPIMAYNNPIDTKVDLRPELLAQLHDEGLIVSVKEFSGDVRRGYEVAEVAPGLDLSIGTDDVVLELGIAGAKGWVSGYPSVFPRATTELYTLSTSDDPVDWARARTLYRDLHPVLRWDSRTEFVHAIKIGLDMVGRRGGRLRPPRGFLDEDVRARIVADTQGVIDKGYN